MSKAPLADWITLPVVRVLALDVLTAILAIGFALAIQGGAS